MMIVLLLLPGHTKERGRAGADGVTLTVNEIKKKKF
jgi:riboflavin synthase alpha subunit